MKRIRFLLLALLVLPPIGCGGGSSPPSLRSAPTLLVSISPSSASLLQGAQQQFTASVTGSTDAAVLWSAPNGGQISSSGMYTAPQTAGSYPVVATSVADFTKSASATVTVAAVAVSISPTSPSLYTGGTQQFSATVTGTMNNAVTWSASAGTVSGTGFYTAPAAAGTYTVTATSAADTSKSASATVTVAAPVAVSISPTSASLFTGGTQQFTATVTGTTNNAVTWSATGGTVSASGLYTAPDMAGTYTVTATSAADTTKSGSATVTVAAPVAVSISPTSVSLYTGGIQQFTAAVTGTTNTAVTWTASGGTVSSSGLYIAPGTTGTYTVSATSVADNTKSASAIVTVTAPPISVSISPSVATVVEGGAQQFTATVTGTTNTAVTWAATGGTVSSTGLYTAGTTLGVYTVTATSAADNTSSATARVTVGPNLTGNWVFVLTLLDSNGANLGLLLLNMNLPSQTDQNGVYLASPPSAVFLYAPATSSGNAPLFYGSVPASPFYWSAWVKLTTLEISLSLPPANNQVTASANGGCLVSSVSFTFMGMPNGQWWVGNYDSSGSSSSGFTGSISSNCSPNWPVQNSGTLRGNFVAVKVPPILGDYTGNTPVYYGVVDSTPDFNLLSYSAAPYGDFDGVTLTAATQVGDWVFGNSPNGPICGYDPSFDPSLTNIPVGQSPWPAGVHQLMILGGWSYSPNIADLTQPGDCAFVLPLNDPVETLYLP